MTEPPRPPGDDPTTPPPDPTAPLPPPASHPAPGEAPASGYAPPPQYDAPPPPYGGYPPAGGYQPGGAYQQGGYQQGGYPPPGGYLPPAGYGSVDEKNWALVAHFGGAAGAFLGGWLGFVPPLIAMLAKGNQSPRVRAHAVEALNFQLTWIGVSIALSLLLCCATVVTLGLGAGGFALLGVPWLVATILGVVAGLKANEGELFRYPLSIRLVK